VPYRSTLKKFQAEWIGNPPGLSGGIDGKVQLVDDLPFVTGDLTNNTGHDLRMVYLVVHHPHAVTGAKADEFFGQDMVLYTSFWPKGNKISLTKQFDNTKNGGAPHISNDKQLTNPSSIVFLQGRIKRDDRRTSLENWLDFWVKDDFRHSGGFSDNREYIEQDTLSPRSFPILSFFDRLPVTQNKIDTSNNNQAPDGSRANFLRRGVREFDMSPAISGGSMAIIAVSDSKEEELPFPLDVNGDRIRGKGTIYYQFVVPVDRSAVTKAPTLKPPENPAAEPGKGKASG